MQPEAAANLTDARWSRKLETICKPRKVISKTYTITSAKVDVIYNKAIPNVMVNGCRCYEYSTCLPSVFLCEFEGIAIVVDLHD